MSQPRPRSAAGISLFPFLAVLLCMMGALILLLFAIAQHAKTQAASIHAQADAQRQQAGHDQQQVNDQVADLEWRIEQLRTSRQRTAEQLAEQRQELSRTEEQTRRIRDELMELERAAGQLQQLSGGKRAQQDRLRAELREWESKEAMLRGAVQQARDTAANQKNSYAIVPYLGRNGTRRHPVYIECRADAIVFMPEEVALHVNDFQLPIGPGNPLAAGLRAAVEHLERTSGGNQEIGAPYPLLIVRPDGIEAFHVAREAMKSWGFEFGYEFVPADWKLKYYPPSEPLAQVTRKAIAESHVRAAVLARAAPSLYRRPNRRVSGGGDGGVSNDNRGGGAAGAGLGDTGLGGTGMAAGRGTRLGDGGQPLRGGTSEPTGGDELGNDQPGNEAGPRLGVASTVRQGATTDQGQNGAEQGAGGGGPRFDISRKSTSSDGAGEAFATDQPDEPAPYQPGLYVDPGSSTARAASRDDDTPSPSTAQRQKESLAVTRGSDWGLQGSKRGNTPMTRPITVRCEADRLTLMASRGGQRVIPIQGETETSVDALVEGVQQQIEAWGIAGKQMYWRPVLMLDVAPGGQRVAADLQALLEGSGLDVQQKQSSQARRGTPSR